LDEFVKILVNEYPLIFKDGSAVIKIGPLIEKQFFPQSFSGNKETKMARDFLGFLT
jgi:hypothetical protein